MKRILIAISALLALVGCSVSPAERWSAEKANDWYAAQPWPVGCVFMPSYGGTPVEIWGKEYFNPDVVDRELALAEDLGFNAIRLFLYGLVNGKQQCQYPWNPMEDGKPVPFTKEPEVWFHDLFRPDYTPYSEEEVRFIKETIL